MKRRRMIILLSVPVAILSLGLLLAGWVLHTEKGARWLLTRVTNGLEDRLSMEKVSGNFSDGLVITGFRFDQKGIKIEVAQLETVVGFSLQPLELNVRSLRAGGLKVRSGLEETSMPDTLVSAQGRIALRTPYEHQWTGDGKIFVPAAKADFQFELEGVPEDYDLELQVMMGTDRLPAINLALKGQGDLESLQLDSLSANSGFLQSTATGVVTWSDAPTVNLEVDVQRFEPALWAPEWPDEQFVYGQLALYLEESGIAVKRFSVEMAGTDLVLEGAGELDLQAGLVQAGLSWHRFTWPLGIDAYEISSNSGQLQISGVPGDWGFEGDLELDTPEYPGGRFELKGSGGMDSAEVYIGTGEALGGTVAGQASLDWSGDLHWNAQLEVKQVDTSAFTADWPARLDAKLRLSQDIADDSFDLQFDSLHGELKGRSLDGSGGVEIHQSAIRFKALKLQSGNSSVLLDGDPDDPVGLEFVLDVNKPGWMADSLGGEVSGRGRIALRAPQPVLDIELEAHDFTWGDTRVESIFIRPVAGKAASGFNLVILAKNLEFAGLNMQTVSAIIDGDRDRQTLDLGLSIPGHELAARFDGSLTDWNSVVNNAWLGQLTGLDLIANEKTLASLQDPAPLAVSASGITLGKACFDIAVSGGLCLESGWQAKGQLDLSASLSALPLGLSQLVYDHQFEFTQTLNGDIEWTHKPGTHPSGSAAINISAGQFGDEHDEYDRVTTAEGFFGFQLSNGNLTAGEFDIPFPDIGQIDFDYAISGLTLDGTGRVDGTIRADLNDISVLEGLLPGLEQVGGQLKTDLRVSGPVLDPSLDGFIGLKNGTADVSYLGTQLRQVRLEGSVSSTDNALLQGDFVAGDGRGEITLEAEFSDWLAPDMKMTLKGSSLRLLNTTELRMNADTDIRLAWRRGEWLIDGDVIVKQARIAPITFVVSQEVESEDIQLVAGELPYGGAEQIAKPIRLSGSLDVSLGDQVKIDTELAKAKLSGSVNLTWQGETIPIANGSIHADGTLSVFGPKLHVKDGQLRFPEVPVINPLLEIRAERDVFGNTQVRTAGVSITGPARRPVIEAFTSPLTTTDRAWALLITGSDISYGQGVGAFEVGAYIAPRIYLSYGISLFDDDNVVSARYDLKKGFGIKASSGQRESGFDMSYTIDR